MPGTNKELMKRLATETGESGCPSVDAGLVIGGLQLILETVTTAKPLPEGLSRLLPAGQSRVPEVAATLDGATGDYYLSGDAMRWSPAPAEGAHNA
jgi:hypothetical protein